eukprot:2461030-Alexandrium_andersonii.AAC.1
MSPPCMRSRRVPQGCRAPRDFWTVSVHCLTSLPCCLRVRLERGRAASCASAFCHFPPSTVKLVKVGPGAALEELAAEALGAGTAGMGAPFTSTSAGR